MNSPLELPACCYEAAAPSTRRDSGKEGRTTEAEKCGGGGGRCVLFMGRGETKSISLLYQSYVGLMRINFKEKFTLKVKG